MGGRCIGYGAADLGILRAVSVGRMANAGIVYRAG